MTGGKADIRQRNTHRGPRHRARKRAIQAIYQWQVSHEEAGDILEQFHAEQDLSRVDADYFDGLVRGVTATAAELDRALEPLLDRPLDQVDPVERAILRLAAYELRHRPELPWRVVLDEAVELAHVFGAEQGHAYVNGVLDRCAREWRAAESGG